MPVLEKHSDHASLVGGSAAFVASGAGAYSVDGKRPQMRAA